MTMSPELRARWSAALREEGRVQGRGTLCMVTPDGVRHQCCLDVLIDLYRADHPGALVVTTPENGAMGYADMAYTDDVKITEYRQTGNETAGGVTGVLPSVVARWAGTRPDPRMDSYSSATHLNDGVRLSFPEIADLIDDPATPID